MESLKDALDYTVFWDYRAILLKGLAYNFIVWAWAALLAITLGFVVCMMRISNSRTLRTIALVQSELIRNTPDYVMLMWTYVVLPLLISLMIGAKVSLPPVLAAVLAIGLIYGGYLTETFRSGIQAVPRGHAEAARALAMPRLTIMRRIILPQALRHVVPELLNNLVSLFKATTLVSLIAVPDLLYNIAVVSIYAGRPLSLYTYAALIYFLLIFAAATLVRRFTDTWRRRGWA